MIRNIIQMDDININISLNGASNNKTKDGYTVSSCFGMPLQRLDVAQLPSYWNYDESTGNNSGITDQGALYTFEEFIGGDHSSSLTPRNKSVGDKDSADLANISSELTKEFLNLESNSPPPLSDKLRETLKEHREKRKAKNNFNNTSIKPNKSDSSVTQFDNLSTVEKSAPESQTEASAQCAMLQQAFCPTVSSNVYGAQRNADDASVYAYSAERDNCEPDGNVRRKFSFQRVFSDSLDDNVVGTSADGNATNYIETATSTTEKPVTSKKRNRPSGQTRRRRHYCESLTGTLFSKLMHCFRVTTNIINMGRHQQYTINTTNSNQPTTSTAGQPGKYSWDCERSVDVDDYNICERKNEMIIRTSGQASSQQIIIENCTTCIIVVLDCCASVTIDDCRDCLILLGPCKGSIFIRNCFRCSLYLICQQFRSRDCHDIRIRLFCATAPTIEDSNMEIGPLNICYNRLEKHIAEAELSPFVNNWFRVHNFTPESSKYTLIEPNAREIQEDSEDLPSECPLSDRFSREFLTIPQVNDLNLTLRPSASFFFRIPRNDGRSATSNEEKVLILVKSSDKRINIKTPQELYHDVRQLLKRLLAANEDHNADGPSIRLVGMYDIDPKHSEFENLFHYKPNKTSAGKLLAIELAGQASIFRDICMRALTAIGDPPNIQLVDTAKTLFTIQQLMRFSESQNHI